MQQHNALSRRSLKLYALMLSIGSFVC